MFESAIQGFAVALTLENLIFVTVGVLIGMVVGVLPGLGPAATMALLLPITYGMDPVSAIIMLAGVYYGSMYGGTITAVLLNIPGEAASIVTAIDGHAMAKQGRAGPALGIAAISSFVGGTTSIIGLSLLAPLLAVVALGFGPPEYTALAILGLLLVAYLGTKSFSRALIAAALGLLFATVGQDPVTGIPRFTFGFTELLAGLDIVVIAMGLFGIGEILYSLEDRNMGKPLIPKLSRVLPTKQDLKQSLASIARGGPIGFVIGTLPGAGAMVAALASYGAEKRFARSTTVPLGRGAVQGVAGPETANNAAATASFIPTLSLGIPGSPTMAILVGALMLQGIQPGPRMVNERPDVFWGVISSMYIGNLILLVLSIPLIGVFIRILRIRMGILLPVAMMLCLVGVYTINNSIFDVWAAILFGLLGYALRKFGYDPGPLVLAFILGAILETSFRQSLLVSGGSMGIFLSRPASAGMLLAAFAIILIAVIRLWIARSKKSIRRADDPSSTLVDR